MQASKLVQVSTFSNFINEVKDRLTVAQIRAAISHLEYYDFDGFYEVIEYTGNNFEELYEDISEGRLSYNRCDLEGTAYGDGDFDPLQRLITLGIDVSEPESSDTWYLAIYTPLQAFDKEREILEII